MTRRKRKESNESGGANENSHSQSTRTRTKSSKSDESQDKSTKKSASNSFHSNSDQNIGNSDNNDCSDRMGTRRSLRRPAASNDDSSVTTPPLKKSRKIIESINNSSNESETSGEAMPDNEVSVATPHESQSQDGKRDRKRKRKLVDINDDSSLHEEKKEQSSELKRKGKEVSQEKKDTKDTKRRRKITDSPNRRLSGEQSTSNPQIKEDSEHCVCPVPGYPIVDDVDWENWCEPSDSKKDILCGRSWKQSSKSSDNDSSCFSILTYNILAESLLKTSHYFKKISQLHWNQKNRHKLLLKELKALNADILCLQEVEDDYQPMLSADMLSLGYNGFYAGSESDGRTEGIAIFYRSSRFTETSRKSVPLAKIADSLINELNLPKDQLSGIREYACEPQMFQCIILKCEKSGKEICVGNTHISYAKHLKPDLRCMQIARGIDHIISFSSSNQGSEKPLPFIFCGDFNSIPASAAYQLCRDGYLNDDMLNSLQRNRNISINNSEENKALVNVLWKAFQHSSSDLQSCYYDVLNREPPMTLNLEGNAGCVDYLWFTKDGLSADAVLIPRSSVIRHLIDSVPNADFPSDHLSLCARLSFK